jgi:hypothetical protein
MFSNRIGPPSCPSAAPCCPAEIWSWVKEHVASNGDVVVVVELVAGARGALGADDVVELDDPVFRLWGDADGLPQPPHTTANVAPHASAAKNPLPMR